MDTCVPEHLKVSTHKYADDCTQSERVALGKSSNMQEVLDSVKNWSDNNKINTSGDSTLEILEARYSNKLFSNKRFGHAHFLLRCAYGPRAFRVLAHLGPLQFPHLGPSALCGSFGAHVHLGLVRIKGPCAFRGLGHLGPNSKFVCH